MPLSSLDRTGWPLADWRAAYRTGRPKLNDVYDTLLCDEPDTAWIARIDEARLCPQLQQLEQRRVAAGGDISRLPLYGIPFAAKDNLDAAGWPMTAACPADDGDELQRGGYIQI